MHGREHAGGDGSEHALALRAQLHGEADVLRVLHDAVGPGDGGKADGGRVAAGDDDAADALRVPDGLGPGIEVVGDHGVDERGVPRLAVHAHGDALVVYAAAVGLVHQRHGGGGHAGHGALHHRRIDVVGAGGDGEHGRFRDALGGGAGSAVAAEDDDAAHAQLLEHPGGAHGVLHRGLDLKVQHAQREAEHPVALQRILHGVADHEGLGHEICALHAQALGREDDALADIYFFVVVYGRGVGDQAADVLARRRVRDDAYGSHSTTPCMYVPNSALP